jgi:stress response protein YsnF
MRGPEITEREHETTLHAEEAVVDKEVVPKERVRLDKDVVTDEVEVSEELRKERIEPEGDTGLRDDDRGARS